MLLGRASGATVSPAAPWTRPSLQSLPGQLVVQPVEGEVRAGVMAVRAGGVTTHRVPPGPPGQAAVSAVAGAVRAGQEKVPVTPVLATPCSVPPDGWRQSTGWWEAPPLLTPLKGSEKLAGAGCAPPQSPGSPTVTHRRWAAFYPDGFLCAVVTAGLTPLVSTGYTGTVTPPAPPAPQPGHVLPV